MVPELPPFESPADTADGPPVACPADTAERLLLLLHYTIDWDSSWVADPKYRKTYWDEQLPGRVRRAAYRGRGAPPGGRPLFEQPDGQVVGRLVEDQQARRDRQRARTVDAAGRPAGQLALGPVVVLLGQ